MFKLGLIVNPRAGIGGPLALKGSDDVASPRSGSAGESRAAARCRRVLEQLAESGEPVRLYGFSGDMGAGPAEAAGFACEVVGAPAGDITSATDTRKAAQCLEAAGVDLLLFVGGDGTARDVCASVAERLPVLGVPAGVKMHSGVYAVSPEGAAEILLALIRGGLVDIAPAEVRDIDERAFREGRVRSRHFGELLVPRLGEFLQQTKQAGREVEELAVAEVAAGFVDIMEPETLYLIGPGSTTAAIMEELGLENTLLGFDALCDETVLGSDLDETGLLALLDWHQGPAMAVITAIGGQGHILGRGNQQLSPAVLERLGTDNLLVVATKGKIRALEGRPLLVDTDDTALNRKLSGYIRVLTGYRDEILYKVSAGTA